MARKALIVKAKKIPKYSTRKVARCLVCGRSRAVLHLDGGRICRIHFREYVYQGLAPGFKKAS
jgi:small subunit ribosomal protein S14